MNMVTTNLDFQLCLPSSREDSLWQVYELEKGYKYVHTHTNTKIAATVTITLQKNNTYFF